MTGSQGWLRRGCAGFVGMAWVLAGIAAASAVPVAQAPPTIKDPQVSYTAALQAAVLARWQVPASVRAGDMCAIKLTLLPGGEVFSATVQPGCEFDVQGREALLAAVRQASPLPYRGHEAVFQRETVVRFVRPVAPAPIAPIKPPAQFQEHLLQVRAIEAQPLDEEARCRAYPDLPGSEWPEGAGKARCLLLRAPILSLDDIDTQLGTSKGAADLDRRFRALMQAHYDDPAQREQIFIAYSIFDADPKAERVARRWLEQSPGSAFARMALGDAYARQGWKARGTQWASETPDAQMERMGSLFQRAVPLLAEALEKEARLSPACEQLAAIGRMSSDQLQRWAMGECLKVDAQSFFVLEEVMTQAEPRWGGSADAMRAAAALIAARAQQSPVLLTLTAVPIGYEADMADDWSEIVPDTVAASLKAPNAGYMARAGRGMYAQGDRWRGLAYVSQALRFHPGDDDELALRAEILLELGDAEWALRDAQRAAAVAPASGRRHYLLARVARRALGEREARAPLLQAMEDADTRERAYELYCQTYSMLGELAAAEACTQALVAEFPRNAEGWRMMAWVRGVQDDPAQALAVEQFMKYQDLDRWPHHARDLERYRRLKSAQP
ncbi:DUF4034 domain-containing protein [Pseudoxanthomonas sp. Root630]|uniref:DUF4034 domain-containing protein n=1 Tax=Pseudoxanthomonas sp. Root630 TaxID=1736574 RepID=UPI000A9471AF|nr:DUF4034 domain-containing protein [Pseudoxanthomonas sp. Root630]